MTFEQIAWLPLCAGVTIAGLVLSFFAFRRRGAAAGMRVAAWALLPAAAYLTGALQALWTIGATVVGFVTSLVFNPVVWAGVAVAGLSAVLFVVSGVVRGRRLAKGAGKKAPATPAGETRTAGAAPGGAPGKTPGAGQAGKPAVTAGEGRKSDDDFSDIEDILRRRGIS
ncbi:cellulose synthase [Nonomuraea lactucae]|uniref:cellulose synthase n=1 Tax=Nonomuraea lactucae TaxID=2249762 RepID=UPI000DE5243B|nr:cellulose synthase [Nonomuraea lactucae]